MITDILAWSGRYLYVDWYQIVRHDSFKPLIQAIPDRIHTHLITHSFIKWFVCVKKIKTSTYKPGVLPNKYALKF